MINELDLRRLWTDLDKYEKELEEESKSLEDIWIKIAELKKTNDNDINKLLHSPELMFLDPDTKICLNVGGQLFETTCSVLTRDPFSILAALCRVDSHYIENPEQIFFFDRDWWIFRHVLAYLRSSVLPTDVDTLKELYTEATFYRLELLQKAIEDIPLDQINDYNLSVTKNRK